MKIRYEDRDFRDLRNEFRFVAVSTTRVSGELLDEFTQSLGEPLVAASKDFWLVVLDHQGIKLAATEGKSLCVEGSLSREKLIQFLSSHKAPSVDAKRLYQDTLRQAKSEGKHVLVQETATWCGPCHRLSRFLDANRNWEKDYLWIKMDHRWSGSREVMAELRDGAKGGIPWFAIVDENGSVLATSNHSETQKNIGFPSEKSGQIHFENILRATRKRMTESDIQGLIEALKKASS